MYKIFTEKNTIEKVKKKDRYVTIYIGKLNFIKISML